jgi:hypothetical protein
MPIDAGQEYIKLLQGQNKSTDTSSIKKYYRDAELDQRLGEWKGTVQQYNALTGLANQEKTMADISAKIGGIKSMAVQAANLQKAGIPVTSTTELAPTEEFAKMFPDLSKKELGEQTYRYGANGAEVLSPAGEWVSATEQLKKENAQLGQPFTPEQNTTSNEGTTPVTIKPEQVSLGSTDIGDIINEIDTGTLNSPEVVLGQAKAELLTDEEKASASDALSKLQQTLASRGMTFSGIRTQQEASIAAESLSKLSGINIDLAGKIVSAAREEQNRRIDAIKAQQTAADSALKSMGYVIDPITGALTKTLEMQRFEQPAYQEINGGLYNIDTGEWVIKPTEATFTAQEQRKLQQAGIDWKSDEGYNKALNFLYGEEGISAPSTLKDLAKLGYERKGGEQGGYNFFKNGSPISADKIVQETGIALSTLLAGSLNPADVERLKTDVDPFEAAIQQALKAALETKTD